jgi:hypothetical protein
MNISEKVKKQLEEVRGAYEFAHLRTQGGRKKLWENIRKLSKFSSRYEDAWAGDWAEHFNVYRYDFDPQQEELILVDEKDIKADLGRVSRIGLDGVRDQIPAITRSFSTVREKFVAELSFIADHSQFSGETKLLNQIEEFQWGSKPGEYIRSRRPARILTDNPSIFNRGMPVPPHIAVGEEIVFTMSILASYDEFEKLLQRLIRQLEIKTTSEGESDPGKTTAEQPLYNILERFHLAALKLRNRHGKRETLKITDEYDVQDLLHVLLQIPYEDIRPEEYTPSYAGGASRIDFLLKREKILVEVKKTRPDLRAREVGNELLIDIARYRSHPDCKRLVCFVYDPDHLINNPRGVEDDLRSQSTPEMSVQVYIRPS